jgi:hypothetical protein
VGGEKCSMVYGVKGPGVEPEPSRVAGPRKTLKQRRAAVVEVHCLFKLSAPPLCNLQYSATLNEPTTDGLCF